MAYYGLTNDIKQCKKCVYWRKVCHANGDNNVCHYNLDNNKTRVQLGDKCGSFEGKVARR
jgi:hypothetical protein